MFISYLHYSRNKGKINTREENEHLFIPENIMEAYKYSKYWSGGLLASNFTFSKKRAPSKWPHLLKEEAPDQGFKGTFQSQLALMMYTVVLAWLSPEWTPVEISLSKIRGSSPSSNWQIIYGLDTGNPGGREGKGSWYGYVRGQGLWTACN